jgi:predicted methyltransferase
VAVSKPTHALAKALLRTRVALKRFSYSGFGRDSWQQPDQVVAAFGLRDGDRVADIGAGGGYFTFRLARAVAPSGVVYAVDTDRDLPSTLAAEALDQGLGNVVAVDAEPDDPGLPEPVDLGLLSNAFHHLPDRRAYLPRLAQHLKPGGRVAIVETRPTGLYRLSGHSTAPGTIRSELEAAGYTLVAEHHFLAKQSFLVLERG